MHSADARINELKAVAAKQQDLLRVALHLLSEGDLEYDGSPLTCSLPDSKKRASALVAMAAGQSVNTILTLSGARGIPVRDLYPVARAAIESFINAAFFLAADGHVAERALRYVAYASWKHSNRTVGSGDFVLQLRSDPDAANTLAGRFPEFSGKGQGSWTSLDVPSRIRVVGERAGKAAGSRLLAAYALIYGISSEVIHGSTYGVSYFFEAHLSGEPTEESFRLATAHQVEDILVATLHGAAGFLAAFFELQQMTAPAEIEQGLFERLVAIGAYDEPRTNLPPTVH